MNVLTFTTLWPNYEKPGLGVFIKHRTLALVRQTDVHSLRVVAPVPFFPRRLAVKLMPGRWREAARIPVTESAFGLSVRHPRFFCPPRVGMRWYGRWMGYGAAAVVHSLHCETPIDVIDAHYVYPDGEAAIRLGETLNVPVCVTARGTDINVFSRLPHIRPLVERTLKQAQGVIAVSAALKSRMVDLGIDSEKIAVIRNGVDSQLFHWRDQAAARRQLGLTADDKILVTVGALVPVKGMDKLVSAMRIVVQAQPCARLYIFGEGPEETALKAQILALGLRNHVFLLGLKPQQELRDWYSASDVFCLASHREGCPNVVIEAMSCGAPVVATAVGGIGELIADKRSGLLVDEHDSCVPVLARCLCTALAHDWQRQAIAAYAGGRGWTEVAEEVLAYWHSRRIC